MDLELKHVRLTQALCEARDTHRGLCCYIERAGINDDLGSKLLDSMDLMENIKEQRRKVSADMMKLKLALEGLVEFVGGINSKDVL